MAVLSVQEQDEFYKEINYRYTKQVDYLKSIDEYDLEVDSLNLMAEPKQRIIAKAGKGGDSAFGEDVYMELAECNVLRKPFKRSEIDNLIAAYLQGRDPQEARDELVERYTQFEKDRFASDLDELNKKWYEVEQNITTERKYQKLETDTDKQRYIGDRKTQIEESKDLAEKSLKQKAENRHSHVNRVFKYFHTGMGVNYPAIGFGDDGMTTSPALFLGFHIDENRKNPYAPSAIDAKFAIADSRKFVKLSLSGDQRNEIDRIIARSSDMSRWEKDQVIKDWDETIKQSMVNRKNRHIMTGNLLVAAGEYINGKLVAYTTFDGKDRKGLLMPENWDPETSSVKSSINVPVQKVAKYILASTPGTENRLDNGISVFKTHRDTFQIIIPKKQINKSIYKDTEIMGCLINSRDGFEMRSGNMVGEAHPGQMATIIDLFGEKYSLSISKSRAFFDEFLSHLKNDDMPKENELTRQAIQMFEADKKGFARRVEDQKPKPKPANPDRERMKKKARAKALMLKLQFEF